MMLPFFLFPNFGNNKLSCVCIERNCLDSMVDRIRFKNLRALLLQVSGNGTPNVVSDRRCVVVVVEVAVVVVVFVVLCVCLLRGLVRLLSTGSRVEQMAFWPLFLLSCKIAK